MSVTIHGRGYDLPAELTTCPCCYRGTLTFDGKWSWRCTYIRPTKTPRPCGYGISISAMFENAGLETAFQVRQVTLSALTLSPFALELVTNGVISLSWVEAQTVYLRYDALPTDEETREFRMTDAMMRRQKELGE